MELELLSLCATFMHSLSWIKPKKGRKGFCLKVHQESSHSCMDISGSNGFLRSRVSGQSFLMYRPMFLLFDIYDRVKSSYDLPWKDVHSTDFKSVFAQKTLHRPGRIDACEISLIVA